MARSATALAAALCLTMACGGSNATGAKVGLTPGTITLPPQGTQQFAATLDGAASTAVFWSIPEATGGTVTNQGLYTAPAALGTYHVIATNQLDLAQSASATITVQSGAIVNVSPTSTTVAINKTAQFTATVTGTTNTSVSWSVAEGASGGSISSGGIYLAPGTTGTYHVVAKSDEDPSRSAQATVTVTQPPATVTIHPGAASTPVNGTVTFTATVDNAANNNVTWSVQEGSAGGSITSGGVYTAPGTGGTYHVVATSVAAPTAHASADVIVRAPPQVGVWTNVTPDNADVSSNLSCGNFGATAATVDPMRPSDLYTQFNCQGIWKSVDFGSTWTGPINTGTHGADQNGAGGIIIPQGSTTTPPLMYAAYIRGSPGFWRSKDGGVNWTNYNIAPGGSRQDFYTPAVDPYDANHLLIAGHEMNVLAESSDGGETWTSVHIETGMEENGGTAFVFFVDTGTASTTRTTWLWMAQQSGGTYGTWRTANSGANWTKVEKNEHPHGASQIYQPGGGVIFMAGAYSDLGWGVLRSTDYGAHWAHVGAGTNETMVIGTSKKVYALYGWAIGQGQTVDPGLQIAAQPASTGWAASSTPASMTQGPAAMATTFDGTHNIILSANFNGGLWLYIEP